MVGGGDRAPALVLLAALLGRDPVAVTGTTPGPGWAALVTEVRDGLRRARPSAPTRSRCSRPTQAVEAAELTGLLLQAAARHTPVLLSSAGDVAAAALLARRRNRASTGWLTAGIGPGADAVRAAHSDLSLTPVLDLGLDHPEAVELALAVLLGGVELARG